MKRFRFLLVAFFALASVSLLKAQTYDTVWTKYVDGSVYGIKFHPVNSHFITSGGKANVYNVSDGSLVKALEGGNKDFALSKSGTFLAVGNSEDANDSSTIWIYNGLSYDLIKTMRLPAYYQVLQIEISPNDSILAVGAKGRVLFYSLPNGTFVKQILVGDTLTGKDIYDLTFSPDGAELCYRTFTTTKTSEWGTIHFIDVAHDSLESATFGSGYTTTTYPVKYSSDGKYILAAPPIYEDNPNRYEYLVINAATKTLLLDKMPSGSDNICEGAFFAKNDRYVVSTNQAATLIKIWNFAEKTLANSFETLAGGAAIIDISSDNNYIISSNGIALYHTPNPLGVDKGEIFDNENYIFPNPSKAEVNIKTSTFNFASQNYKFSDLSGIEYTASLIKEDAISKTFSVQDLPNGAYFLNLTNKNSKLSYKFIVNK